MVRRHKSRSCRNSASSTIVHFRKQFQNQLFTSAHERPRLDARRASITYRTRSLPVARILAKLPAHDATRVDGVGLGSSAAEVRWGDIFTEPLMGDISTDR